MSKMDSGLKRGSVPQSGPHFQSALSNPSTETPIVSTIPVSVTIEEKTKSPERIREGIQIHYVDLIYDETKLLGKGAYGQVFLGTFRKEPVAIKIYDFRGVLLAKDRAAILHEAETMDQLRSKYLVGFRGIFLEPRYGLVMEYCEGGTLAQRLAKTEISIDFTQQLLWGKQISYGLHALHSVNILHRDLKSDNILLDAFNQAKIADFGLSQIKTSSSSQSQKTGSIASAAGTIPWIAPELFEGHAHSKAADVYSLGMVLWEIVARQTPFSGRMAPVIIGMVLAGKRETLPKECPEVFRLMILACWDGDPQKRSTAEVVGDQFTAVLKSLESIPSIVSEETKNSSTHSSMASSSSNSSSSIISSKKQTAVEQKELFPDDLSDLFPITLGSKKPVTDLLESKESSSEKDKPESSEVKLLVPTSTALPHPSAPMSQWESAMFMAIEKGDQVAVKACLQHGVWSMCRLEIDKNQQDPDNRNGETPLHSAVRFIQEQIMRDLITHRADINAKSKYDITPLFIAALKGFEIGVKILLEARANVDQPYVQTDVVSSYDGKKITVTQTPLFIASEKGYDPCLRLLLENKANVNNRCEGVLKNKYNATLLYVMPPISIAIKYNQISCLRTLIEFKADINLASEAHFSWAAKTISPLTIAVGHKHELCVRELIKAKIDVNHKNNKSVLEFATMLCWEVGVSLLLEIKANPNPSTPQKYVLNNKYSIATQDPIPLLGPLLFISGDIGSWNPLLAPTVDNFPEEQRFAVVKQLIQAKADVNTQLTIKDITGKTFSEVARDSKFFQLAQLLDDVSSGKIKPSQVAGTLFNPHYKPPQNFQKDTSDSCILC